MYASANVFSAGMICLIGANLLFAVRGVLAKQLNRGRGRARMRVTMRVRVGLAVRVCLCVSSFLRCFCLIM